MDVLAFASFAVLVVAWIVAPTRTVVSTSRTAVATAEPATIAGKAA